MKGFKFSHYISRMALNGTSVAVYCNKDQSVYRLIAERGGCKIRSSIEVHLTNEEYEEYEELPHDPYNLMDRFLHTASMCGIYFH